MSTQARKDWSDDARLTAYAFGELEGAELTELLTEIEGDEDAAAVVAELRGMGDVLQSEFVAEASSTEAPLLTSAQRARIAAGAPVVKGFFGMNALQWAGIAATAVVVAGATKYLTSSETGHFLTASLDEAPAAGAVANSEATRAYDVRFSTLEDLGYVGNDGPQSLDDGLNGRVEMEIMEAETLSDLGYAESRDGANEGAEDFADEDGRTSEFSREQYARIYENPFQLVASEPLSTFSIDVDTASYSNVRRMLRDGHLPNPDAVRIEELVNYFPYRYPNPSSDAPFSVNVEIGSAPWAERHRLVRIGLKGRMTHALERAPANLVFLLDVSGSMDNPDKLPLLKQALGMLVQNLGERDRIAVVVYAGASGLALPSTSCEQAVSIQMALEGLDAGGSTNGGAGIELAYDVARKNFIEGGINRVILATDGDFNVGVTDDGSLTRMIAEKAKSGVFLTVLGFGSGNLQDAKMEQLADKGNGNYAYIDSTFEAHKVLVEEMGSTLEVIAKDVKIQVEFNPVRVQAYRLLGYENRMLAAQDFNDDQKDAGEIGAGHTVTALYEVVPVGVELDVPGIDPLRYQTPKLASSQAYGDEVLNLKLRYKLPDGDTSILIEHPIVDEGSNFAELSEDTRFAAMVAAFGMLLRDSQYKGTATWELVTPLATQSVGEDPGSYRAQFLGLVRRAQELSQ